MMGIEVGVDSLRVNMLSKGKVLILQDKPTKRRYLVINMESVEAEPIKRELLRYNRPPPPPEERLPLPRIGNKDQELKSITVSYNNNVFKAKLLLTDDGGQHEVDYTLAEAVTLSLQTRVPIYAEESALDSAGITVTV